LPKPKRLTKYRKMRTVPVVKSDLELMLKQGVFSLQLLQPLIAMSQVSLQRVSFSLEGRHIVVPQRL